VSFQERNPYIIERLVVSLSYLTMGFIGFIWLVLGAFTKTRSSEFVRYHIFQAIFISILLFILNALIGIICDALSFIPFVKVLIQNVYFLLNAPIFLHYSIIQTVFYLFLAYLMITSALGIYTYVPFVSDIISQNVGRGR